MSSLRLCVCVGCSALDHSSVSHTSTSGSINSQKRSSLKVSFPPYTLSASHFSASHLIGSSLGAALVWLRTCGLPTRPHTPLAPHNLPHTLFCVTYFSLSHTFLAPHLLDSTFDWLLTCGDPPLNWYLLGSSFDRLRTWLH
jgi:hypothetical protein